MVIEAGASSSTSRGGPLAGIRIVEVAGLGAGPFCAMMLADMGADVVRVDRPTPAPYDGVLGRSRRSIAIDLKAEAGLSLLLDLIGRADGLIEAFRPGVAERLGFGPDACQAKNPKLIYGRATGWGQEGPWRMMAGHDINYIALSGVLSMVGRPGAAPVPPLNLVGDFGGGGMMLAFGMVCAMLESRISGVGQVVDGAMIDGSALLATMFFEMTGEADVERASAGPTPSTAVPPITTPMRLPTGSGWPSGPWKANSGLRLWSSSASADRISPTR